MDNKHVTTLILGFLMSFATAALSDSSQGSTIAEVCPRIVSRSEWRACKARSSQPLPITPTPYVIVHHGGISEYCTEQKTCSAIVRYYQDLHQNVRGWSDIGYQFLIGEDGNVYEGRGWDLVGAHAPNYNNQSIGICMIGDFNNVLPNEVALKALNSLISCGVSLGKIRKDYHLIGHRQVRATECPGETLYKYVQNMSNWTDKPVAFQQPAGTAR